MEVAATCKHKGCLIIYAFPVTESIVCPECKNDTFYKYTKDEHGWMLCSNSKCSFAILESDYNMIMSEVLRLDTKKRKIIVRKDNEQRKFRKL